MDPERLIHGGSSDEAALLRSAAREGPSIGSRARTLAVLGVATGVLAATATATSAATAATAAGSQVAASGGGIAGATGFATIAKWLGIGIAGTAVVVGGAYQVRSTFDDAGHVGARPSTVQVEQNDAPPRALDRSAPAQSPAPVAVAPSVDESLVDAPAVEAPAVEATTVEAAPPIQPAPPPHVPVAAAPAVAAATPPSAPAPVAPPAVVGPSLADEVASLDAARTALASGQSGAAEALLAGHGAKFQNGSLAPEARVLAVEVLAQSGRHAEAIAGAEAFILEYPSSPHRTRLQSIIATSRAALSSP